MRQRSCCGAFLILMFFYLTGCKSILGDFDKNFPENSEDTDTIDPNGTDLDSVRTDVHTGRPYHRASDTENMYEDSNDISTDSETPKEVTQTDNLSHCESPVTFPDAALDRVIRETLGFDDDAIICRSHVEQISVLVADSLGISDITGLEHLTNLVELNLIDNNFTDITPLTKNIGLDGGDRVYLEHNTLDCQDAEVRFKLTELVSRNLALVSDCFTCGLENVEFLDERLLAIVQETTGIFQGEIPLSAVLDIEELLAPPPSEGEVPIQNLQGVECLANMTRMTLAHNSISSAEPIRGLYSMKSINLLGNSIQNVEPFIALSELEHLDLSDNGIVNISPLQSPRQFLQSITELHLMANEISDISPLVANPYLDAGDGITLLSNPIDCRDSVTRIHLNKLLRRELDLYVKCFYCQLGGVDIKDNELATIIRNQLQLSAEESIPLRRALEIYELEINDTNSISDLRGLECIANLESLTIRNSGISNLDPLRGLDGLAKLDLSFNQISDVMPLSMLSALENLNLSRNQILDVDGLQTLASLVELDISANEADGILLSNINPISELIHLKGLNAGHNNLEDISPLAGLHSLNTLALESSNLQDLAPLVTNTGITGSGDTIILPGNPAVCTQENLAHVETLVNREVHVRHSCE